MVASSKLMAVASKDGVSITEHFGHATQFRIYEVSPNSCTFVENREVAHYRRMLTRPAVRQVPLKEGAAVFG